MCYNQVLLNFSLQVIAQCLLPTAATGISIPTKKERCSSVISLTIGSTQPTLKLPKTMVDIYPSIIALFLPLPVNCFFVTY